MREGHPSALEAWQFARSEFQGAALDDQRLGTRLVRIAYDLSRNPDQSLPAACGGWASTKAAYRFFSNRKVRREKVQQVHMEATARRIASEAEVLVVQDTTTLNFSHHPATQGLGKIGSRKWPNQLQGALVHSSLAVRVGTHDVLGLIDQGQKRLERAGDRLHGLELAFHGRDLCRKPVESPRLVPELPLRPGQFLVGQR